MNYSIKFSAEGIKDGARFVADLNNLLVKGCINVKDIIEAEGKVRINITTSKPKQVVVNNMLTVLKTLHGRGVFTRYTDLQIRHVEELLQHD